MEYRATVRYARITPRKLRLVADQVRRKNVNEAQSILRFSSRRGAYFLNKLLNSALANAGQNSEVNLDNLYIAKLLVEAGPILKRWRAAPMGRAAPIKKRTSHATIVLSEPAQSAPQQSASTRKRRTK